MQHLIKLIVLLVTTALFSQKTETIISPLGKTIPVSEIEHFIESQMKATGSPGVSLAVINNGEVAFHMVKGQSSPGQKITTKTIFEGASLSKPLFAFFTLQLVEQGVLDLDTPLYTYLPYPDIAQDERYKKITARMVLSHRTGFPNWRDENGKVGLTIDFEPGTQFQYSGEGFQYLALVLQKLLGTDPNGLQALFNKQVAKPLGLKHTRFIQDTRNEKNKALAFKDGKWLPAYFHGDKEFGSAYGIHSEAKDFAKWIIALMEKKGLSTSSYNELFKNQTTLPEDNDNRRHGITHVTLGFYSGVLPIGQIYGHGGNNGKRFTSLFFFNPETKWGAVLFTNSSYGEQMGIEFLQYMMQAGS